MRQRVNDKMRVRQRWLAPVARLPVKWATSFAYHVLKRPVYQQRLQRVAGRMNQHADTAFNGYTPVAGDVFAAAYFKAGTNWLMHMCYQVIEHGEGEFDHIQDVMPWPDAAQPRFWMNLFDSTAYQSRSGHRVIKTHLPANKVPVSDQARYIAVTRDPKDCAASGYYFFRTLFFGPAAPPPSLWLTHMASKEAAFGRWDAFTDSWFRLRNKPNVLFLRFESIKKDPLAAVRQIAAFLDVKLSDEALDKVVKKTSFSAMKAINHRFFPVSQSMWTSSSGSIIRKGQSGDGVELFDAKHLREFDHDMAAGLKRIGSEFPYAKHYALRDEKPQ